MVRYSAGIVTAYGAAKRAGYTGTYEDFCRQQAEYAESAAAVEQAKTTAVNAAATATTKAGEATTAATAAQTAKAQTEQAASQAQTDISTAKATALSGIDTAKSTAVSAVQSEGQTQTTNARAQAQAASQSAAAAQASAATAGAAKASAEAAATNAATSATNAATSATNAAQSASDAQNVLDSIPEDYSDLSEDVDKLKADLGDKSKLETLDKTNIVSAINSLNRVVRIIANRDTSWAGIRENVKSGYGEILYPVGTDFSVSCPSGAPYNDIVFTVVNHRVDNDEPIMTLLMKRCIYGIQFDAPQAAFVASEAMAAGTYHFKLLDNYDTGYDGGKYVQFTIVNPLVAGDQIVITWGYNQSWIGKNAYVYHAFDVTPAETCVMSEGQGGTYLGVADGASANLNHTHRLRFGSNNWKESAVREWLNSDAQAGEWQTQQTRFQRPCSYASSKAGFISYLDPSFVATVRTGTHLNRTNQVFDLLGTKVAYSTEERFFLPSNEEIGFYSESGIVCGSLFSFYDGANNDDRIKYDIANENTARYWWLRTPVPSTADSERTVSSSGALSSGYASNGNGAAAACEI